MIKKIFHICTIIISSFSFSANVFAVEQNNTQIVVIDGMYISQQSVAMIDAKAQFDKLMAKYQKVTKEIQKDIGQKSKILESQEGVLKPEEFNKKKEDFEKELRQRQQELYDERQYIEKLHEKAEMTFSDNIRKIIKDICKGKGYLVIDKASIVYNDESIDMSDIVIDELNKRLKKINVEVEKK